MAVEMHMLSVDHLLSLRIFHSNLVTIQWYLFIAYVLRSTLRIHAYTAIYPLYTSSLSLQLLSNAFSMCWKQYSVIGQLPCLMDLELTSTCGGMRPAIFFISLMSGYFMFRNAAGEEWIPLLYFESLYSLHSVSPYSTVAFIDSASLQYGLPETSCRLGMDLPRDFGRGIISKRTFRATGDSVFIKLLFTLVANSPNRTA